MAFIRSLTFPFCLPNLAATSPPTASMLFKYQTIFWLFMGFNVFKKTDNSFIENVKLLQLPSWSQVGCFTVECLWSYRYVYLCL